MRRFVPLAAAMLLTAAAEPGELLQAVHAGQATWLLSDTGIVSRLDDDATAPVTVLFPIHALGLCRQRHALVAVGTSDAGWQLLRWRENKWVAAPPTPLAPGERYVGAACTDGGVTILTDQRMIDQQRGIVPITGYQRSMSIRTVVYRERDALLVGTNAGEWGGKLIRIPFSTGRVQEVQGTGAPIQDIAPAPGKPGCVILAVGLMHFFPSGQLTELCGDRARPLYARPWEPETFKANAKRAVAGPTIAFYSLARAADGSLRAIATDGIYRITAKGAVTGPTPLPAFSPRGDLRVARVAPDLELVLTGVNARASVGGAMPLAVPR